MLSVRKTSYKNGVVNQNGTCKFYQVLGNIFIMITFCELHRFSHFLVLEIIWYTRTVKCSNWSYVIK